MHIIDIGIPYGDGEIQDVLAFSNELADAVAVMHDGAAVHSGAGFGYRDIQVEFNLGVQAEGAVQYIYQRLREKYGNDKGYYVSWGTEMRLP
jgi:hypothetical protein